ncbi:unnamed protein product, partial [Iphiclides podalirius]
MGRVIGRETESFVDQEIVRAIDTFIERPIVARVQRFGATSACDNYTNSPFGWGGPRGNGASRNSFSVIYYHYGVVDSIMAMGYETSLREEQPPLGMCSPRPNICL